MAEAEGAGMASERVRRLRAQATRLAHAAEHLLVEAAGKSDDAVGRERKGLLLAEAQVRATLAVFAEMKANRQPDVGAVETDQPSTTREDQP